VSYWVVLRGAPVRQFYADAETMAAQGVATDAKHLLLLPLPAIESALSVDGPQSSSLSVLLRNDAGQARALLAVPPLGAAVEVRDAAGVVFAGRLVEVSLGDTATLQVES
jgi:hypothetical protein